MISPAPDSSTRSASSLLRVTPVAALSVLSMVLVFGCGNNGSADNGATNGSGATHGGGATGGNGDAPFSGAVLCSLAFTPEGASGFIRLVSDIELESGEEIDSLEGAIEFPGGVGCAVQDRSVFALSVESPIVTRYDEVGGALVEGESVSFANLGVTSLGAGPATVFISDTKAYYLDADSLQLVVWNPIAMETIGSIPLAVSDPPQGLRQIGVRLNVIDGQVVAYNNYRNEQDVFVARTDFWFVDPETDEVVATDVTEQCGALGVVVSTAANGDSYIGTTNGSAAMEDALGLPGSFPTCAVRIRAGSREVDAAYLADFNALTGGLPTAGPIAIGNDRALLFAYDTNEIPIDPNLTAREHVNLVNWNFYEWELGSEQPAIRVESIPTGTGTQNTREFDGRGFIARNSSDFTVTELLDVTRRPLETTYTFTNITNVLARLGEAPDARMAQRVEPRAGFGVLPF